MALVRWEPVRELNSLQSEMNRLFNTFFDTPTTARQRRARAAGSPSMDLVETDDALRPPGRPARPRARATSRSSSRTTSSRSRASARPSRRRSSEGYYRVERALRRVPPLADAARGRRRRRDRRDVRQGRPRGPHPQARGAQAAPRRDQGRRRRARDRGLRRAGSTPRPRRVSARGPVAPSPRARVVAQASSIGRRPPRPRSARRRRRTQTEQREPADDDHDRAAEAGDVHEPLGPAPDEVGQRARSTSPSRSRRARSRTGTSATPSG